MPNHIHLVWELMEPNEKESPHASFMKFTWHQFQFEMKNENSEYQWLGYIEFVCA